MTNLSNRYKGYLTCIQCGLPTSQRCSDCRRPLHRLNRQKELAECVIPHYRKAHPPTVKVVTK